MLGLKLNHVSKRGHCTYHNRIECPQRTYDVMITSLFTTLFWWDNRFFVIREICVFFLCENVKSAENWREIVICNPCRGREIPVFRTWICKKNAIFHREIVMLKLYFSWSLFWCLYLEIYYAKSWNWPFCGVKPWSAPYISRENVNWVPLNHPTIPVYLC